MARKYGPELQKKRVPPYPPPKSKMNRQVLFSFKKSFDHTSLGFWRGVWGEPNFLWNYFFVEQKRNWYFIFNSWSSTQIKLLGCDEWSQIEFIFQNPFLESIAKGPYFSAIAHTGTSPNSFCTFFIFSRFDIFLFFSKEFHNIKIELKNLKKFISRADCKRSTLFFLVYLVGFDIVLFEFDDLSDDEDFQNDWWLGKPVPNRENAVF